jgi:ribonucleoside-diphosphate reductase beta chain
METSLKSIDPILAENKDRFVIFPIRYPEIYKLYEDSLSMFWTHHELDLTEDLKDWCKITDNEKHFISYVLAFFAASDGIVNENINMNFATEVQIPEMRLFYGYQTMVEGIHQITYGLLIDTYIKDPVQKDHLFRSIETIPIIGKKAEWAMKYFDRNIPFCERIVAFAAVEGIFFSGSFCAIFWLKKRGLMPGLATSNLWISRDESMHCRGAVLLHKTLQPENRASNEKIREIINSAVEIETEFITEALPVSLIGMNAKLMSDYIRFVANYWLQELGVEKLYDVTNPFEFMDMISMGGKTNFFENRVTEYAKSGVGVRPEDMIFSLDEQF